MAGATSDLGRIESETDVDRLRAWLLPGQEGQVGESMRWIGIVYGRMSLARTSADPLAAS